MTYKVSIEEVKVYPHPNADRLELVGIGEQQYVVEKGLYKTGDLAVAIPKNSIVSHPVFIREWGQYLQGPNGNRVGFKMMRDQESQGIVVREDLFTEITGKTFKDFEVGVDISDVLDVVQYIPEVPDNIKDTVEVYNGKPFNRDIKHDCKYAVTSLDKFTEGEPITITSKLHGTQINVLWNYDSNDKLAAKCLRFSSKGLWDRGLVFKEHADNKYSQGWRNLFKLPGSSAQFWNRLELIKGSNIFESQVQIIGEVVGVKGGFSYGFTEPTMFIYSIYIDGKYIDLNLIRDLDIHIVPELYRGPFDPILTMDIANEFAQQKECPLDSKTMNEGVVISNGKYFIKNKNSKFMKKHGDNEIN